MPYILTMSANIAFDALEAIDNTVTEGFVPTMHIVKQSGYSYYTVMPVLVELRRLGVLTSKTGPRGGYKRARTLTARELAGMFGTRFKWPDKPADELTKADRVQRALLGVLGNIRV